MVKIGLIFTDVFIIFAWLFNERVFFFLSCKCALCILKDDLLFTLFTALLWLFSF